MKHCDDNSICGSRRDFLVKTVFAAGGIVLTLSGAGTAFADPFENVTVTIDDKSPLRKIGGTVIVDSTAGKIIVLRTGESTFVAFSAVCTHKRGIVEYDAASREFVCPKHGSRFDSSTGAVKESPATDPIAKYNATGTAASVTVTVGS